MSTHAGPTVLKRGAHISEDGRYRYRLSRVWREDHGAPMVWVMLNPSTADDRTDDLTIRKCMGFADRWGYGAMHVLNLWALRSTDPQALGRESDPEGESQLANSIAWGEVLTADHEIVVAAWGATAVPGLGFSLALGQWRDHGEWWCLGRCKDGDPRHPSRLGYATPLERWS